MEFTFGEFLATKRKESGLTQKDLAKILYVSESTISKWEQNRANPDITVIPTLSKILGVSEHELITASIDTEQREKDKQAKKWKRLTYGWNLFFIIAYGIALLTCFICNLAINHTLNWFWIVFSSLLLCASFTTLPQYVKKFKLLILSITPLLCLILLLGICCVYTFGNWFWVVTFPVIVGFIMVFSPIYIKVYNVPKFIKNHKFILCSLINLLFTIAMLYIIEDFVIANNFSNLEWVTNFALPICFYCFAIAIGIIVIIQYSKMNSWFKASSTLLLFAIIWLPTQYILNVLLFNVWDIEKPTTIIPNLGKWVQPYINNNVNFILISSLLLLSIVFGIIGALRHKK